MMRKKQEANNHVLSILIIPYKSTTISNICGIFVLK